MHVLTAAGRAAARRARTTIVLSVLASVGVCAAVLTPLAAAGSVAAREFSFTIDVGNYEPPGPARASSRPITGFRYLVNLDNSGDASDPDSSLHPGVHPVESYSPVVEDGTTAGETARLTLPEGRYLVSVEASGHRSWGVHVRLPEDGGTTKHVDLIPLPLRPGQIVARVFSDTRPVNGAADPAEGGLAGFRIVLRGLGRAAVTSDSTGPDGTVTVANLPPGAYEVSAVPPPGAGWVQTTTSAGGASIDAVVTSAPARSTVYSFGFVRRLDFSSSSNPASQGQRYTGRIAGCARYAVRFGPFEAPVVNETELFKGGWVALSTGASGEEAYAAPLQDTAACAAGAIDIGDVPPGNYTMFIWEERLSSVPREVDVVVPPGPSGTGAAVDLAGDDGSGTIRVFRFFGWLSGHVYDDQNGNGVRDLRPTPEPGLPGVDVRIRARDGSVEQAAVTDASGSYEFPTALSPLSRFEVAEVGSGRYASTRASFHSEYSQVIGAARGVAVPSRLGDGVAAAEVVTAGHRSIVDWGKRPLAPAQPGEIAGVVHYATSAQAGAEPYEPGVPGVRVRLWTVGADARPNTADDVLVGDYRDGDGTDKWEQPNDCDVLDSTGAPVFPEPTLPVGPECLEFPILGNETKDAVFDGSYSFVDMCPAPQGWPCARADRVALAPGDYVVGVDAPAGYEIAQNKRQVRLGEGQNAGADFFLSTQVPAPGRVFGLVSDSVNVDTDQASPWFNEPRALPDIPIGIRDATYRLLTTVKSDEYGFYEALLPTADTSECGASATVCPGTYVFVVNDPGDPGRPNPSFDPGFATRVVTVAVMPGTTTPLETRLDPISGSPCPDYTGPEFFSVDRVAMRRLGPAQERRVTIRGLGFGDDRFDPNDPSQPGNVSLVGLGGKPNELPNGSYTRWSDSEITVTIPPSLSPGPYQLVVTAPASGTAPTGITLHLLGTGYDPPLKYVDGAKGSESNAGSEDSPFRTIQKAIDAAGDGALILVEPGEYDENVILYRRVKLQGFGPGGINGAKVLTDPSADPRRRVPGSVIDAGFFNDPEVRSDWDRTLERAEDAVRISQTVPKGAGITVVAKDGSFGRGPGRAQIDGFAIRFARPDALGAGGGGIFVNGYGRFLQVSNNLVAANAGEAGGGIVLGLPDRGSDVGNANDGITISHNRILGNEGGVAIYSGADGYTVSGNDICSNVSGGDGAGLSHSGRSDGGTVVDNRFAFNEAAGAGGRVLIAGEGPSGSGAVDVARNVFAGNQADGDGGAIEVRNALTSRIGIRNNILANNNAAGAGGALALADSANVRLINDTIARNTSTSSCSGCVGSGPHSAALASKPNSPAFQATLPPGAPVFSSPILLNDLFWENEAFTFDPTAAPAAVGGQLLVSHGLADFEVLGEPDLPFSPRYSLLGAPYAGADPTSTSFAPRADPFASVYRSVFDAGFDAGTGRAVVNLESAGAQPPGGYHLCGSCADASPAIDNGAPSIDAGVPDTPIIAPSIDVDGDERPADGNGNGTAGFDIGADEFVPEARK